VSMTVEATPVRWRLKSPATLRVLMDQEGVSVRGLASAAGLNGHSMIQQLRDGSRPGCSSEVADAIAGRLNTTRETLFEARRLRRRR
jgi:hypothetical protein